MLQLFGSKKNQSQAPALLVDKVYLHERAKWAAIVALAEQQPDTIFIAWFEASLQLYQRLFTHVGLLTTRIMMATELSEQLQETQQPVFVEHYPLMQQEIKLVEKWNRNNIPVYSSMDEPLFLHFGSEKMLPLIKLLGFKEQAAIEHSYVTQAITKGQTKIALQVQEEKPAASQQEWMRLNLQA